MAELRLPPEVGLEKTCEHVTRRIGLPIHTLTMPLGGVTSGMTILADDEFWICADQNTSPWHQAHVTRHELGHLLMGHDAKSAVVEDALSLWAPSLDARVAMRHMGIGTLYRRHHAYDKPAELEAEIMAGLLEERMSPHLSRPAPLQGKALQIAALLSPVLQHTSAGHSA
ncbi:MULTISPECIES: hypothetical protein [unclassified Streptomyces]|uniref:hypothetical protein n=1 Tax=unclassified Streptomyces TaxID=2593676 RepID=UPI003326921C